jgi:hypothetical protein
VGYSGHPQYEYVFENAWMYLGRLEQERSKKLEACRLKNIEVAVTSATESFFISTL